MNDGTSSVLGFLSYAGVLNTVTSNLLHFRAEKHGFTLSKTSTRSVRQCDTHVFVRHCSVPSTRCSYSYAFLVERNILSHHNDNCSLSKLVCLN